MEISEFTREAMESVGFKGFITFDRLQNIRPPEGEGVYVILREAEVIPVFLEKSTGGRFKGKDPTVDRVLLENKWVEGACVIYIGKATNLRKRLEQYRRFGRGEPIGHWGGRYIWQCGDVGDYLVGWLSTKEPPRDVEKSLISRFSELYGRRPFANIDD
jgi:hypothetical protein